MYQEALNGDEIALDLLYEESFKKIKDFIRDRMWRTNN